jgi:fructokinase
MDRTEMMQPGLRIASIGELLWDLLPNGPRLGGAPANFAAMSANFTATSKEMAAAVFLISRVGDDSLGREACQQLATHHVKLDFISTDPQHPTGTVTVTLDAEQSPAYRIHEQAAWDYIPAAPQMAALAPALDAVCFGTLAQRSAVSRETLRSFVESTRVDCVRVFDVNLRAPYWTPETLAWGCARATILKMNLEEVPHVAQALAAPGQQQTPVRLAHFLLRQFPVELIAITRGAKGSLLVTRKETHEHPGVAVELVDSIGAGDAFTAALTHSVLRRCPLPLAAEAANRWGAWAATQRGGMPWMDKHLAGPPFSSLRLLR